MNDLFSDRLGTDGFPVFVRKLDKRSTWGHTSDAIEERLSSVVRLMFPKDNSRFSLYEVGSDDELKRVVAGLNSFRRRLKDQMDLVAFTKEELEQAGIRFDDSPGNTGCKTADKLHVDVFASEHSAFSDLCKAVFLRERLAFRITKSEAKQIAEELKAFGCLVFPDNKTCPCTPV